MVKVNYNYNISILPIGKFDYERAMWESDLEKIEHRKSIYRLLTEEKFSSPNVENGLLLLNTFLKDNGEVDRFDFDTMESIEFANKCTLLNHDVIVPNSISKLIEQDGNNSRFIKVLSCRIRYINDTIQLEIETDLVQTLITNQIDIQNILFLLMETVELFESLFQSTIKEGEICSAYISKKMLDMGNGFEPLAYTWLFSNEINKIYTDTLTLIQNGQETINKFKGAFSLIHHKLVQLLMNTADRLGIVLYDYQSRLKENLLEANKGYLVRISYIEEKGFSILSSDCPIEHTLSNHLVETSYLFEAYLKRWGLNTLTYRVQYSPCNLKILGHYASKEPVPVIK